MQNSKPHPTVQKIMDRAAKRRSAMQALFDSGWTYTRIGKKFGVSRQRITQILNPETSK